jgi:hypothetical protein
MYHLEDAVSPFDELDVDAEAVTQFVRQTGGSGQVVSNYTIFDRYRGHGFSLPRGIIATRAGLGEIYGSKPRSGRLADCARITGPSPGAWETPTKRGSTNDHRPPRSRRSTRLRP